MQPVRHHLINAAGLATADTEARDPKPAPMTLRRSEFRAQRRARIVARVIDFAWLFGCAMAGGFAGLLIGAL